MGDGCDHEHLEQVVHLPPSLCVFVHQLCIFPFVSATATVIAFLMKYLYYFTNSVGLLVLVGLWHVANNLTTTPTVARAVGKQMSCPSVHSEGARHGRR